MIKQTELEIAIEEIRKKHGEVTPQLVVNEAKYSDNPLHKEFDWDDASAANQHRLAVARALLRRVEYIGQDITGKSTPAVCYVHEPNTKEQQYVPLREVAKSQKQSIELLNQELAQIEGNIRRAQRIANVLHLREQVDENLHAIVDELPRPGFGTGKRPPPPKPPKGKGGRSKESRVNA